MAQRVAAGEPVIVGSGPVRAGLGVSNRRRPCLLTACVLWLCGACAMGGHAAPDAAPLVAPTRAIAVEGVRDGRADFLPLMRQEQRVPAVVGARFFALQARFAARAASTVVLVVPGLLGDCVSAQAVPFGDGVMRTPQRSATEAYGLYEDLGLKSVRLVPLPGRASSAANGVALAAAIRAAAAERGVRHIVIVSYSKGTADALHALHALERDGAWPQQLHALVSVAGIVRGTPLADRHQTLYDALSSHVAPLDCSPEQGGSLASLTPAERTAWLAANAPPRRLRLYSIVAHADPLRMAWPLRGTYDELATIDPRNDGQVLADDALLPGSTLLAEALSDHWALALPLERHPQAWLRALAAPPYPREALFRALVKTALAGD
jgi:hypothetical protein